MSKQTIGREYQHIEDFLIDGGSDSVLEVIDHLSLISKQPELLDYKWDGSASVYWGRDDSGQFYFIPKNQWNKGELLTKDQLYDNILNTGRQRPTQSTEDFVKSRESFGSLLMKLWRLFELNTPQDFRGFLNGDLIFTERLGNDLTITPNKVTFKFEKDSFDGRIQTAEVMVVVHGILDEFGMDVNGNIYQVSDEHIDGFNDSKDLIVLNTQCPSNDTIDIQDKLNIIREYVSNNRKHIDYISEYKTDGFTTLKSKLYTYSVAFGRSRESLTVLNWVRHSKISDNHKKEIVKLSKSPSWNKFWAVYVILQSLKLDILTELFKYDNTMSELGIDQTINGFYGGEGFVTQMDNGQHIKLINPEFRYSDTNQRFK